MPHSFSSLNYDSLYTILTYVKAYDIESLLLSSKDLNESIREVCAYYKMQLGKVAYTQRIPRMHIREIWNQRSPLAERILSAATPKSDPYNVYVKHPCGNIRLLAPSGNEFQRMHYWIYRIQINGNYWVHNKINPSAIHDAFHGYCYKDLNEFNKAFKTLTRKRIGFTAKVVSVGGKSYVDIVSVHRVRMYDSHIQLRFIFTRLSVKKNDKEFELEKISERGFDYNIPGSKSACFGHHYHIKESDCRVALQGDFIYLEAKSSFWKISKFGVKPYLEKCSVFATDRFTRHNGERSAPFQLKQIHDGYACLDRSKSDLRILLKRNNEERIIFFRGNYVWPKIRYLPEESLLKDCFVISHPNGTTKIEV